MDYVIRFFGIIMIVGSLNDLPYRALIPVSNESDRFCKSVSLPGGAAVAKHEAYLRINDNDIVNTAQWPTAEFEPCKDTTQHCTLFHIQNASNIGIDSSFTP